MGLHHRLAVSADIPALTAIIDAAISELQRGFLDESQIASSRAIMGIDSQLIADSTYFAIESEDGDLIGCGGWSRRATRYGSNSTPGRDSHLLDPAVDAARVRAMYTHPSYARRGVGRMILTLCETAAAREGFSRWSSWPHCPASRSTRRTASGRCNASRTRPVACRSISSRWRSPSTQH